MDLALNNLQRLICYKPHQTNQPNQILNNLFFFQITLISFGKLRIKLFSLWLWVVVQAGLFNLCLAIGVSEWIL